MKGVGKTIVFPLEEGTGNRGFPGRERSERRESPLRGTIRLTLFAHRSTPSRSRSRVVNQKWENDEFQPSLFVAKFT